MNLADMRISQPLCGWSRCRAFRWNAGRDSNPLSRTIPNRIKGLFIFWLSKKWKS